MAITNYQEYDTNEIEWLRKFYPDHSAKETQIAFNEHFKTQYSLSQIKHRLQKNKITNKFDGKFQKNNKSWNSGLAIKEDYPDIYKRYETGKVYRFKKGDNPANTLPVGSTKKRRDGVLIKVAMPNVWKFRSRWVYEQHYGVELKKSDKILHLDGDKHNDSIDNLIAVTDAIIIRLNKEKLITSDKELTKSAVYRQQILARIRELEKR